MSAAQPSSYFLGMEPTEGDPVHSRALYQQRVVQNCQLDDQEIKTRQAFKNNDYYVFPYGKETTDDLMGALTDEIIVKRKDHILQDPYEDSNSKRAKGVSDDIYRKTKNDQLESYLLPVISSLNGLAIQKEMMENKSLAEQLYVINSHFIGVGVAAYERGYGSDANTIGRLDLAGDIGGVRTGCLRGPKTIRAGELIVWTAPPPKDSKLVQNLPQRTVLDFQTNKRERAQDRDGTSANKAIFVMEPYDPLNVVSFETLQEIFLKPLDELLKQNLLKAAGGGRVNITPTREGVMKDPNITETFKNFLLRFWPLLDNDNKVYIVDTYIRDMLLMLMHTNATEVSLRNGATKKYGDALYEILSQDLAKTLKDIKHILDPQAANIQTLPADVPDQFKQRLFNLTQRFMNNQNKINLDYKRRILAVALSDGHPNARFDYRLGSYAT